MEKDITLGLENELEEKQEEVSYNELRKIAKEKGIDVPKNVKKEELIKLIEESEKPEILSLDNQPVSPIVLSNDKEEIPRGFVSLKTKPKKNSMGVFKGRMYKVIGNGFAVWCDNGQSFELKNLR